MSNPATLSLAQAAKALSARQIAPHELLQACRGRAAYWQPRINAFISQDAYSGHGSGPLRQHS